MVKRIANKGVRVGKEAFEFCFATRPKRAESLHFLYQNSATRSKFEIHLCPAYFTYKK